MGGCIHCPKEHSDIMEERRKKGFNDWMDRAPVQESYRNVPQAGWFELGVIGAVFLVGTIVFFLFA